MPSESKDKKVEIYYDGVCNLCSGLAEKIDLSEKGSSFALKNVHTSQLPSGITKDAAMRDVYAVADGKTYRGADAVIRIVEEYPYFRALAHLAQVPGLHFLATVIYRVVEKTRYFVFGRKQNVPTNGSGHVE